MSLDDKDNLTPDSAHYSPDKYIERNFFAGDGLEHNTPLLNVWNEIYEGLGEVKDVLDIGTNATFYHVLAASQHTKSITFSDYDPAARKALNDFVSTGQYDERWHSYAQTQLQLQGVENPNDEDAANVILDLRRKVDGVVHCDVYQADPIGFDPATAGRKYQVVQSHFVSESISSNRQSVEGALSNILSLVEDNGTFIGSFLGECESYKIGEERIAICYLETEDIRQMLDNLGWDSEITRLEVGPAFDLKPGEEQECGSYIVVKATRKAKAENLAVES